MYRETSRFRKMYMSSLQNGHPLNRELLIVYGGGGRRGASLHPSIYARSFAHWQIKNSKVLFAPQLL